jgi:Zn-dependent M32 family carboxypeptidase
MIGKDAPSSCHTEFLEEQIVLEQEQLDSWNQQLTNLTGLLNIPYNSSSSSNNIDEVFLQLEDKLSLLDSLNQGTSDQPKAETVTRERRNESSELHIETLLQKSEKYHES